VRPAVAGRGEVAAGSRCVSCIPRRSIQLATDGLPRPLRRHPRFARPAAAPSPTPSACPVPPAPGSAEVAPKRLERLALRQPGRTCSAGCARVIPASARRSAASGATRERQKSGRCDWLSGRWWRNEEETVDNPRPHPSAVTTTGARIPDARVAERRRAPRQPALHCRNSTVGE